MPQPKRTPDEHTIVGRLVSDPADVPDARIVIGLPGRSSRTGHTRVYLTLDLSEYLEIADEDVLHAQDMDAPEAPLRGTAIWIRRSAQVVHTRSGPQQAQAEFLGGDLSQALMPDALMAPVAASTWTFTLITTTLLCTVVATATICTTTRCATKSPTSATSCCLCPTR